MVAQNRVRVSAIVLSLLFSIALAGEIWVSPLGTSSWDGDCSATPVCSQAAPCAPSGATISSVEGTLCTLYLAGGEYGSSLVSISFEPSSAASLILSSTGSATASLALHINTHANAFGISGLNVKSADLLFTSTSTNKTTIEDSNFELLGSDGSTTIGFVRSTSITLDTHVKNCTFKSTSNSIYYLTSFNQQNLIVEGSHFSAPEVAILGSSTSLSVTNSTFLTPNLYQGEVAELYLSATTISGVSGSMLRSTTTLTNLTILNCTITGAGGFLTPDQLLSDPTLNLLADIEIRSSTFGASFTLGEIYLDASASVIVTTSSFAEVVGSIIVKDDGIVSISGNAFARKYDAPILSISSTVSSTPQPIAIFNNSFAASPLLKTSSLSFVNISSFAASTNVTIDSIQIIGNVTISGIWEVQSSISGSLVASSNDYLVASPSTPAIVTVNSIAIRNVSVDWTSATSLTYAVTNATAGLQGPNTDQGYFIYLSQVPVIQWEEKATGYLPTLGVIYPFSSSLASVVPQAYTTVGRFNYSIAQGNGTHSANILFGERACPSQCDMTHSLPACVASDKCSCAGSYGGAFCKCNMTGMPAAAQCADSGAAEWHFTSSAVLSSLSLPIQQSIVASGDLDVTGALNLKSGSNLTVAGALRLGGNVNISSALLTSNGGSTCSSYTDVHIESHGLVMNASTRVNVNLDLSGVSADSVCNTTSGAYATFKSLVASSSLSSSASIMVNFTASSAKRDVLKALASQLSLSLRLIDSASASNTVNPRVNVVAPSGSCASSSSATPGTVDVVVQPCAPVAPSSPPSKKGSKVLWWYWGIPVIVVGVFLILLLIILLACRPCCKKK